MQDIEVRVEQLADAINADPQAFSELCLGIAQSMQEIEQTDRGITETEIDLADALQFVGKHAETVAEYANPHSS